MSDIKKITIDDVVYVRESDVKSLSLADELDGMKYVMCRTYSAGVFFGYLKELDGKKAIMYNARRVYYWKGAATLSQLATDGTSCPEECKFPCEVKELVLTEVIELITITDKAKKSLQKVSVWEE